MSRLLRMGDKIRSDYREYYIDNVNSISEIDVNECATGSVVYIVTTGTVYMLSENKEWKEQ